MILQQRVWYRAESEAALERLREAGVTVTEPDREPFRAAAQVVYEDWAHRVGGMERIEAIRRMGGPDPVR
jgi:TRAP-type C4-dicarboxylate transport system substrate-binding protein